MAKQSKKSAKPAAVGTTLITFLLDKSGSMSSIRDTTIEAFNDYLAASQKAPGILFSFLQFDSQATEVICSNAPIDTVPFLTHETFVPRGGTPLRDAAYETIRAVEKAVAARDDKPKVVICIQTDGEENQSVHHSWEALRRLIAEKQALDWQFNFMGASIDAYQQSSLMGIAVQNTVSYESNNRAATRSAFTARGLANAAYAVGASNSMAIPDSEAFLSGDVYGQKYGRGQPAPKTPAGS